MWSQKHCEFRKPRFIAHKIKDIVKTLNNVHTTKYYRTRVILFSKSIGAFQVEENWRIFSTYNTHRFLTINAPQILKMRDIIFFFRANYIMGNFKGYFEGAKTFLTPKLSRVQRGTILGSKKLRPPRNIPRNGPLCSLPKTKKIMSRIFKIRGALVFLCPFATRAYL